MKKRAILKRIIIVLSVFLCTEACAFIYLVTSEDSNYTRSLNLGNKYILSEDYDDAIKAFTKAIAIDEKKEDAYIGRGDAYRAKGDYASAWEDYAKAQDLSGDSNLLRDRIGATDIAVVDENGQGVDGATVRLKGNSHSYEFVTDSTGHIVEPIFPETYKVKAVKDEYESIETEISAEKGGFVANPIQLDIGNKAIEALFNDFLSQKESMYGKTCTFTVVRNSDAVNNESPYTRNWEGLSAGLVLGYSVEDFDDDNEDELLLITLVDDYRLQLEMYEIINKEVTLADVNNLDTGTSYGSVALPCGRDSQQKICGLLSAFVTDSNHRIYLQSSEPGLLADGWETYIVSTEYKNNMFSDYKSSHAIGSSIEDSIPDKVQELLDMGVPNIDYDVYNNIFYRLAPLIDCFDGGVHEILHAEQYTTTVEKENSITQKIETETLFATKDGEISEPPEYTESEQESNAQAVSVDDFVNGFWMSLDELLAMFGEPDSSYTHRFQYYYDFENIECLGNNGRLSCRVGEDNMVYSVVWHSYELNQDLFNSLVGKANERITMTPNPHAEDSLISVIGQMDNNEIFITYSEAESTTSIQWSYV